MSDIVQAPTSLDLTMVAGNPFTLIIGAVFTDENSDTISWSDIADPAVWANGFTPTIITTTNQWEIIWTAAQTALMEGPAFAWYFSCEVVVGGVTPVWGPYTLLTGAVTVVSPTEAGTASTSADSLTVSILGVGTAALTIS